MSDDDWDHLSDEQLDRLTAAEADTARGVLALLDRIEELESRPCPHVVEGDEGTNHCALAEANVTRARAERDQALAGAYGDIEAIEEVMHRDADDWIASHPAEALAALEAEGVLAKRYAIPDSPYVTPRERFRWVLVSDAGGRRDAVELWERVDTLPPRIGEEGPTVT